MWVTITILTVLLKQFLSVKAVGEKYYLFYLLLIYFIFFFLNSFCIQQYVNPFSIYNMAVYSEQITFENQFNSILGSLNLESVY